jgi:glycosyltransferase involved in cell wall biosynthesis
MKISVCIATYNGELHISAQLQSILRQIGADDEIIVSDDHSSDSTVEIVKGIEDDRIKLIVNSSNLGHVKNFEKCLFKATGEYVFLCDQDDIWRPGRIAVMLAEMKRSGCKAVASSYSIFHMDEECIDKSEMIISKHLGKSRFLNLLKIFFGKAPYMGCAMAFHRDLLKDVLPIPSHVESHDIWIAMISNVRKTIIHIDDLTLNRRVHSGNLTPLVRRPISKVIKTRFFMLLAFLEITWRVMK